MTYKHIKYCFFIALIFLVMPAAGYSQDGAQSSNTVVMVIGDEAPEADENASHDFINSNPNDEVGKPQGKQEMTVKNIEPTLENGFHIRFEVDSPTISSNLKNADEPLFASRIESNDVQSYTWEGKTAKKRTTTVEEHKFNTKKRLKSWFPKFKKRYRPHLCGRF